MVAAKLPDRGAQMNHYKYSPLLISHRNLTNNLFYIFVLEGDLKDSLRQCHLLRGNVEF
jgi:hypothetical protein